MDKNFDVQYIICECGDNFPNEKLLNLHLAYNHAVVDTFQCEHCSQIFPTAQLYKHHIKQHNVQKPENKPSQNLKTYSKISKTDTSPGNVLKKEPKSPPAIKLEDEWSPVSELLQVAPDVAAEEIAETDNVSVAAISSSSEEDEERYHKCNVCHKIFASEEFYLRHHNKVHANRPPAKNNTKVTEERSPEDRSKGDPLQPTQSTIEALRGTKPVDEAVTEDIKREETKVLQKAPEEVTYFKCDVCKILYPTEKAYSVHYKKKHGGAQLGFQLIEQDLEGPYLPAPAKQDEVRCELCNRTFANERSYRVHFGRVHCPQRLQSPNHECEMCGKKCFSNAALMYHRRTHTGEKPYQCSQCMKKFRGYEHLRIHIRTHTGERPFMCTRCPKTFMRKSALSRHDLVHTGEKPYSCPHCGKCFSQSNGMKSHVNTVHLKLPGPFRHRRKRNQ